MKPRMGVACAMVLGLLLFGGSAAAHEAPAPCRQVRNGAVASLAQWPSDLLHACALHSLLIVGEMHGSNEVPALVRAIAEQAVQERPVRLGLEMPSNMQGAIDDYLRSTGSAADRVTLLRSPFWAGRDGRSSKAMLQLIDTVRVLRARSEDINVFAMEPAYPDHQAVEKAGGYTVVKETGMAASIRRELAGMAPHGLVIALMGNYHSRYEDADLSGAPGRSVTEQLASLSPVVVTPAAVHAQGWNCVAVEGGCAVHAYDSRRAPAGSFPRIVVDHSSKQGPFIVTLWLDRTTASLPAAEER